MSMMALRPAGDAEDLFMLADIIVKIVGVVEVVEEVEEAGVVEEVEVVKELEVVEEVGVAEVWIEMGIAVLQGVG